MAHDHPHDHHHDGHPPRPGHNNGPRAPAQWETPHLPDDDKPEDDGHYHEPDLDLVENAFVEGFASASDPTSFLRLAGIRLVGRDGDGTRFTLLRVEANEATDVGSMTPYLGGEGFRYAPLPAALVSRRRDLAFVYHNGKDITRLTFVEARALTDETPVL